LRKRRAESDSCIRDKKKGSKIKDLGIKAITSHKINKFFYHKKKLNEFKIQILTEPEKDMK